MINTIIQGNASDVMSTIGNNSIDCIITSPPYYQLRDYGDDQQIGLEATPDLYIENLMKVFNQAKRILKQSGTLFVVISDTYSGYKDGVTDRRQSNDMKNDNAGIKKRPILPRKSLMGIPERFILAMLSTGWIYRNEIIWHKPNVIPSSAKDRFTCNFEKIYFFVKKRFYYFNQQYEPMVTSDVSPVRGSKGAIGSQKNSGRRSGSGTQSDDYKVPGDLMRNMRTIWKISNTRNQYDHYAMFSPKIVDRLLDAGCPIGGIVLDPFMGGGTVAVVAMAKKMNYIGIDLNKKYIDIANERISKVKS
jgi:site-specific DNA-methyltransferase (adenine-specific)